jgi:O-antigen ligase
MVSSDSTDLPAVARPWWTRGGGWAAAAPALNWLVPGLVGVLLVLMDRPRLTPMLLPVLFAGLLALLVLLRRPEWALYGMVVTWPMNVVGIRLGGMRLKACQALLFLAIAAWSVRAVVRQQGIHLPGVLVPFGGFIAIAAASSFGGLAWRAPALLTQWALFWVTILALANLIGDRRQLEGVMAAHILGGAISAALGIVQSVTSLAGLHLFDLYQVGRAQGLFNEPDWLGYYLLGVFFPLLAMIGADVWPRRRAWLQTALALVSLAMLLSQVRAAWLGLALGTLLFAVAHRAQTVALLRRAWLPMVGGLILVAAVCLATPEMTEAIGKRFDSFADPNETANMYRIYMAEVTMAMIAENPIVGYGLGSWGPLVGLTGPNAVGTWNILMSVWFDTGLFGLAALLGLWGYVGHAVRRAAARSRDPLLTALLRGLNLGFLAMIVSNQFSDGSYFDFFWAYIGVMTAAARLASRSAAEGGGDACASR